MLSWRTARRLAGPSVAAALAIAVLSPVEAQAAGDQMGGGTPGVAETQQPAKVAAKPIPTGPVARKAAPQETHDEAPAADHVVAELTQTSLKPFSLLGVTWRSGLDDDQTVVEVRWRATGGGWSDWTELHVDPAPEEGGIPGTEPQWVGRADAAAVRVLSEADARPHGLALSTIDPRTPGTTSTAAASGASAAVEPAGSAVQTASTSVAKPAIISRASWGASNSGSCDSPIYGKTTRGAVIHHTAGSNSYSKGESAGIVKATQAYHKGSRGWCDIGYNFLVDKYGQIFEGRAGGVTKPVRAAHSGNDAVNQETMGVSLMGTFASSTPSAAMKTAVVNLVAWRFAQYDLPAKGTYTLGGKKLNRIAGHRNVVSTECPGAKAYAWLSESGGLRDRVATALAAGPAASGEVGGRSVTNVSYTRFDLAWRQFSGAKTYEVAISTSTTTPTACSTGCTAVKPASASAPTFKARGLSKGKVHHVWVRALGSSGQPLSRWQATPKTVKLKVDAPSTQNSVTVPSSRTITVTGHGYGHGIGMSQHGAQGAAKQGVKYGPILSRYYPGTKLTSRTGSIRVLISQDTTDPVTVVGRSGLVFRDVSARKTLKLPTSISGKTVTRWQITQLSSDKKRSTLQYKTTGGFHSYKSTRWTGDGQFEGTIITLDLGSSTARYRGAIRSAVPSKGSTRRDTVNVVNLEHYVRGVIAAEMPASWAPHALYAQAVAARTYGVRAIKSSGYYDICSTTSCQVYGGASRETTSTDAAVKATAGKILTYGGKPAFTQFSSSSGGYTAPGSQPYLKAVADPYDSWSGNANHQWTAKVSAATIEKAYPSIGTLRRITIAKRNGHGDWGGRVSSVSVVGSAKTVTITGDDARWAFGLKSSWFRF